MWHLTFDTILPKWYCPLKRTLKNLLSLNFLLEGIFIFFLKLHSTIRSPECTHADILPKTGIMLSILIQIYNTYTIYIYVKYINNLFLNTHGKSVCLWWVALKLYSFVSVN